MKSNPILASGTYEINSIDSIGLDIYQYPTKCHFKLTQYGNNSNRLTGQIFNVVSEEGTSTTFKRGSTASGTTYSTQTATSGDLGTIATSVSASATGNGSSTTMSLPTLSATPQASFGLSTGAKAGIGAGIAVVAVLIAALIGIIFVLQKKARSNKPNLTLHDVRDNKSELPVHSASDHNKATLHYGAHETQGSNRVETNVPQHQQRNTRPLELE